MGILMMIGVAMLASLAIGSAFDDGEVQDDTDVNDDTNETDLLDSILDENDGEQLESSDGGSPQPNIVFSDLGEAHWDSEDYHSISSEDMEGQSNDTSQAVYVADNEASENLDVTAWSHAIVYSGDGDTVTGGDDHPGDEQFVVISDGGSIVEGGDGDGIFIALNDGNIVKAGAGDDLLLSDGGAAQLEGGAGDDTIYSTNNGWVVPSATSQFEDYFDTSIDTISGGSGNDVIVAASGDIVNSGAGSDEIFLFGYRNSVQDFEVGRDMIVSFLPEGSRHGGAAPSIQEELFELRHEGSLLEIHYDGESLLSVPFSDDLNVAISHEDDPENLIFIMNGDGGYDGADIIFMYYPEEGS